MLIYIKIFWGRPYCNICLQLCIECKWLDLFFMSVFKTVKNWYHWPNNGFTVTLQSAYKIHIFLKRYLWIYFMQGCSSNLFIYFFSIFLIKIFAQINNCEKKKIWLRKIKQYNTYVKLDYWMEHFWFHMQRNINNYILLKLVCPMVKQ